VDSFDKLTAQSALKKFQHIVVETGVEVPAKVRAQYSICDAHWVKQCLISGVLLPEPAQV